MDTPKKNDILQRTSFHLKLEDLAPCDFIVEAAPEELAIKSNIFTLLDKVTKPETILASNTSSISITKIAALTKRPE